MEYRRLGASGLRVSLLGLGGNTFGRFTDQRQTTEIVSTALDQGINFFDTADVYGTGTSEELLGHALSGRRDRALIATKVGMQMSEHPNDSGSSREHIVAGCEASLRRLGVDAIDLYQIHRYDPETPLEETLGALDDLVSAGKVRYVGCSNYAAWQIARAAAVSDRRNFTSYISVQPEYNLLERDIEREIVPCCLDLGLGIIPYFPLAAGVLTGKYKPGEPAPEGTRGYNNARFGSRLQANTLEAVQRLDGWAHERGHTVAEVALAWLASRPAVSTVITGVTKPEQVRANAKAVEWKLSPEDVTQIEQLLDMPKE
ncbi:MAG TPA: aldo/keto reductase [Ktedonobacterales bacterium]